jgi:hypothetical protein
MMHRFPDDEDGLRAKLQRSQLDYVCSSRAAATTLAENYVGLEQVPDMSSTVHDELAKPRRSSAELAGGGKQ